MPAKRVRTRPADAVQIKARSEALRPASASPGANRGALLDAALAELDAAVAVLYDLGRQHPDGAAARTRSDAASAERRLLQALFQQAPAALFLLGCDGVVRRANVAAAQLVRASPGYATGKLFTALIDPPSRAAVQ